MRQNGTESNALSRLMKRLGIPVTRENYLDLAFMGDQPKEMSHEHEMDIPAHLRKLSSSKKVSKYKETNANPIVDKAIGVLSKLPR